MRAIERTSQFKRDFKRESKGRHRAALEEDLRAVVVMLIHDQTLPAKYYDHELTGNWKDHRDCHVRPDLVLIYRKSDDRSLQLVRLGSHNALGL